MAVQRPFFANGEIYHVVIRAVDPLELFRSEKDNLRFIYSLFTLNSMDSLPALFRKRLGISNFSRPDLETMVNLIEKIGERKVLVEILAFCLMPNHVHLLIRQTQEGGISKFMQKTGTSYGMYYNKKYNRKGHVFQGRYGIVHIKDDEQLKTVFVYIHANPVSLIAPGWKQTGIEDLEKTIQFLENYKWSSYPDYLDNKNFPFLTKRDLLKKIMGGTENCKEFVNSWLEFKHELADLKYLTLE